MHPAVSIGAMVAIVLLGHTPQDRLDPIRSLLESSCPSAEMSCVFRLFDERWPFEESALDPAFMAFLENSSDDLVAEYLKHRFMAESNHVIRAVFLSFLSGKGRFQDLPFFVNLLQDDAVVSREGDRSSVMSIDHLRRVIPIEYEYSRARFVESHKFREEIRQRYVRWFRERYRSPPPYDAQYRGFYPPGSTPAEKERHLKWVVDSAY